MEPPAALRGQCKVGSPVPLHHDQSVHSSCISSLCTAMGALVTQPRRHLAPSPVIFEEVGDPQRKESTQMIQMRKWLPAGLRCRRHGHRFHRRGAGHRRKGPSRSPAFATAAYPCPSLALYQSRPVQQNLTALPGGSHRRQHPQGPIALADSGRSTPPASLPPPVTPGRSAARLRDHLREKGSLARQRPHGLGARHHTADAAALDSGALTSTPDACG